MKDYSPNPSRYDAMKWRRCGSSSLRLPVFSLGFWHNFGSVDDFGEATAMVRLAFDSGICSFDLANNYGPEPGSAEENFGRIFRKDLAAHRDEIFVSSKAGHLMWPGPYGDGSSRKSIIASCEQSLRRTGLEYFDIFYSPRYDGETPVEETMQALVDLVRQGKALYAGISKYPPLQQMQAYRYLSSAGVPCLLSQYCYNMFAREEGEAALENAAAEGSGFIAFSPLSQGLLTDKYLHGIPEDSRAARPTGFLQARQVTPEKVAAAAKLGSIAESRGQSLAQMALAWVLRDERVSSVILGPRNCSQLESNLKAMDNAVFSESELQKIDSILNEI